MFKRKRSSLIFGMLLFVVSTTFLPLQAQPVDECKELWTFFNGSSEYYEQVLPTHEMPDRRAKVISDITEGYHFMAVAYPKVLLWAPPSLYALDLCPGDQGSEGLPLYLFFPFWTCCGGLETEIDVTPESVDRLLSNPWGWYTLDSDFRGVGAAVFKPDDACPAQRQKTDCPLSEHYSCSSHWLVSMSHPFYNLIMLPLPRARQSEGEYRFPERTMISVYAIQRRMRLLVRQYTPANIVEPWSCNTESGSGLVQMDETAFCSLVFARNEISGSFKLVTDYEYSLQARDVDDGNLITEIPLLRLNPANSSEIITLEDDQYFDRYNGPIMVTEVQLATNESSDTLRINALLYDYDLWIDRLSVTILKKRADGGCKAFQKKTFQTTVTETPATTVGDNTSTNTTTGEITESGFHWPQIALGITTAGILVTGLRLVILRCIIKPPTRLPL